MHYKDVIITGTGIHSCLGVNTEDFAAALRGCKCGLHHDEERKENGYQSDLCGNVPAVDEECMRGVSSSLYRSLTDIGKYAISAVRQALNEANVSDSFLHEHNVSLIVSNDSTAEAMTKIANIMNTRRDTRYLGSDAVFRSLNSTVSMMLASLLGIHGLSLTVSAACAGGGHALGIAKSLLDANLTEMVIVVGVQEAGLTSMQSFDALRVFSQKKVQPFGKDRDGLAPSGGAACIIMERNFDVHFRCTQNHLVSRLARFSGYGFSSNGSNLVAPSAVWEAKAMYSAMESACMKTSDIDVVFAHATGTVLGDKTEESAIKVLWPDKSVQVVATKGRTGHECWMAGVSQAVQCVLMLQGGFLPGTYSANDSQLDVVTKIRSYQPKNILCNSFGFGGTNSSFIISQSK